MHEKHVTWHGARVWPQHVVDNVREGLANVVIDTLRKSKHHRGSGFMVSKEKSPTVKGNPHFLCRLSLSFLYSRHIPPPIIGEAVSGFRKRNHQRWRGIHISSVVCPWVFSYSRHIPPPPVYNAPC
jgi:hypothetical protein